MNQSVSIEVWTQQGYVRQEETLVSWAKRGGPDGSSNSLNYGSDDRWGAVGHWGGPDSAGARMTRTEAVASLRALPASAVASPRLHFR